MKLHNLPGRAQSGYVTFGCIWEQGEFPGTRDFHLRTSDGTELPVQSRITAYYPDGSVKWTAHTADAGRMTAEVELIGSVLAPDTKSCKENRRGMKAHAGISVIPDFPCVSSSSASSFPMVSMNAGSEKGSFDITAGDVSFTVCSHGRFLFKDFRVNGELRVHGAFPVLKLERRAVEETIETRTVTDFLGEISSMEVEEDGPFHVLFRYEGIHKNPISGEELIPFVIRMGMGIGSDSLSFTHTFLYDGEEKRDFLKGVGISFDARIQGEMYNRHIRFLGDAGSFHESVAQLLSWRPRIPDAVYAAQCRGELLYPEGAVLANIKRILPDMPFWDTYDFCQDNPGHFKVRKKTGIPDVCWLDCLDGQYAGGGLSHGGENGSLSFVLRDFAKRHPAGYTVSGLAGSRTRTDVWFYSPAAEAYDFRHYTDRGYNQVYYEGYDFFGASAYGIAATSECTLSWGSEPVTAEVRLQELAHQVDNPPIYVGDPEFYHRCRAFGYWSLPSRSIESRRYLEEQLDKAIEFYRNEVEQRNWTGLFNHGDFMHTYDKERHVWRYDMGGYAWDNTELVPTLWLWLMFMRSGREDVFTLAEKLSRHASEIDVYHFGRYKGLGSRHNVRHWGCPCKEARIAMAGHHRYFYYLTGDRRMEDIFAELKDNELTFLEKDPLGEFYDKAEMTYPAHARSGPDWSSLCSNWMTQWERFNDAAYREKIMVGIRDIEAAPLKLISGPDFEFDPKTVRLRYIGECSTGGTHLQICMGAPSVWMEMGDLLGYEPWKKMMADYGRFYFLSREQQLRESGGSIGEREFSLPFMAAAMGAYGAWYLGDRNTALAVWRGLLSALISDNNFQGFSMTQAQNVGNKENLIEIPWISTNFAAQWCLNVIMTLDFIEDDLPETLEGIKELLSTFPGTGFRKA
ncbi:hypothetical protein [Parasphaerochaeta coccoides]|nr:hypothetical protein [Parasphaerochaeta coccoides]